MSVLFLVATSVFGAEAGAEGIDWLEMAKGLFGGLALFLFGMEQMSGALKSAMGNQMRELLGKLTRTRLSAVLTGTFVTAVVQSSSVPDRPVEEKVIIRPEFLNEAMIETPTLALQNVRFEIARMGDIVAEMLSDLREAIRELDQVAAQEVLTLKADIDRLLDQALEIQSQSLAEAERGVETTRMEMTLLDNLKRIHTF
jgi:Na+/phosphate symporter